MNFYLQIFNTVPDMPLTNAQLHLSRKKSSDSKPPSCSERPLTLFHATQSTEKRESCAEGQCAPGTSHAASWLLRGHTSSLCLWAAAFCVPEDCVASCSPGCHGCATLLREKAGLLRMKGRVRAVQVLFPDLGPPAEPLSHLLHNKSSAQVLLLWAPF